MIEMPLSCIVQIIKDHLNPTLYTQFNVNKEKYIWQGSDKRTRSFIVKSAFDQIIFEFAIGGNFKFNMQKK